MKRASTASSVLAAMIGMACFGILDPATHIQVENDTRWELDIMLASCGKEFHYLTTVPPDRRRKEEVDPGCYEIEAWIGDARVAESFVHAKEGALNRVPFHE